MGEGDWIERVDLRIVGRQQLLGIISCTRRILWQRMRLIEKADAMFYLCDVAFGRYWCGARWMTASRSTSSSSSRCSRGEGGRLSWGNSGQARACDTVDWVIVTLTAIERDRESSVCARLNCMQPCLGRTVQQTDGRKNCHFSSLKNQLSVEVDQWRPGPDVDDGRSAYLVEGVTRFKNCKSFRIKMLYWVLIV